MRSNDLPRVAAIAALLIPTICTVGTAQDSTSKLVGVANSDALDARSFLDQRRDYVLDLTAFQSSWGETYAGGPLSKSSRENPSAETYYNALVSSHGLSNDVLDSVPFARTSYDHWSAAGFGVNSNASINDPGVSVDTSAAVGNRFGFGVADFNATTGSTIANVIGGTVDYDPVQPSRLYVSRVVGATNGSDYTCSTGSMGFGSCDADGNLVFRMDDFAATCTSFISGQNLFTVDSAARSSAVVNSIGATGGADAGATTWHLDSTQPCGFSVHMTPNLMPESVAGAVPIALDLAFDCAAMAIFGSAFAYGGGSPLSYTASHLGTVTETRGSVSYSNFNLPAVFPTGTHGIAGCLAKTGGVTDAFLAWGESGTGAPVTPLARQVTYPLVDNEDFFTITGDFEFGHYKSQVAFTGGTGPATIGRDQQGRLLMAATGNHSAELTEFAGGAGDPFYGPEWHDNVIAVLRMTSDTDPGTWALAAWTSAGAGKAIEDGAGGIVGFLATEPGFSRPSLGPPMFDSRGNIYFTGYVASNLKLLVKEPGGYSLLRAVYDHVTFSYKLELVLGPNTLLHGRNTDRDYLITRIDVVDSNSIRSSAPFSGSILPGAHAALDPSTLSQSSSKTLGGLVVSVTLVYDADEDGDFDPPSVDPASLDQDYKVLYFVGAADDVDLDGIPDDLDDTTCTAQDDSFEENDSCAAAVPVTSGSYVDLVVGGPSGINLYDGDFDFYSISVPDGGTLDVDIFFSHTQSDVDLYLWDSTLTCGSSGSGFLERSWTSNDDESISYSNTSGSTVNAVIEVRIYSTGTYPCNDYDMDVTLTELGAPFCFGDGSDGAACPCANGTSAGVQPAGCEHSSLGSNLGGRIEPSGSASIADDTDGTPSLTLSVKNGYPSEFGMFVSGTSVSNFGSIGTNGFLCITPDSELNRYFAAPAAPFALDLNGDGDNVSAGFSMAAADNANLPATTVPGVTLWYQFWFRDNPNGTPAGPCDNGSNLTSGTTVNWSA